VEMLPAGLNLHLVISPRTDPQVENTRTSVSNVN